MRLLFVGRISVRKGFEQIVELSHRLADLSDQIELDVIGSKTQWSDYTAHLKELNPRVARYIGPISHHRMAAIYDAAEVLVVPSMYEPGGLVVGEALSRGVCVVASNEVGSAEPIHADCCRRFPAGDVAALEATVRRLISDIRIDRTRLRRLARQEAVRCYSPDANSKQLLAILQEVVSNKRRPDRPCDSTTCTQAETATSVA
jgi:glycosyltransferase involved in cell wall biosynthesis